MIFSWLISNGNVKYYDTVTDTVKETDTNGVNVSPVSPATETDREEFRSYYPSSSPEEISARDATVVQLTSAIQFVVDKKENFTYTKESMEEVVSRTNSAVSAYKNFEYPSSYTDKLVIELLSETNSYFSLVLSSFDKLISLAGFTAIKYQGIIDSLEYRVTQLENG